VAICEWSIMKSLRMPEADVLPQNAGASLRPKVQKHRIVAELGP
jgi:hypothetical protein